MMERVIGDLTTRVLEQVAKPVNSITTLVHIMGIPMMAHVFMYLAEINAFLQPGHGKKITTLILAVSARTIIII
jgi:hypothetical protein